MSLLALKPEIAANVVTPPPGNFKFFVDSITLQLSVKDSTGATTPVSNFLDTFKLYPANHSTSGATSIYTLDLTGRPTPVAGKTINIKIVTTNTYGTIQVTIPTVGTFNLFKTTGVSFQAGELKAGQIISIIIDSGVAYFIGGFVQTDLIPVADTNALKALMTSNSLVVGSWYQFAFTTQYTINNAIASAAAPETLMVLAVSTNAVASTAFSVLYPQDEIQLDLNDATYGAKIIHRRDTIKRLQAPFDWRNVKFRRGNDPLAVSYYTITNPAAPTFTSNFQDVYCFGNSQTGVGCSNITIEPVALNNSNAAITPYVGWGIDNCNITVTNCSNVHIRNSHSLAIGGISGSNNPAGGGSLVIDNSYEGLIIGGSNGVIENSTQFYLHGNNCTSGDGWSIHRFSIKNSTNVNLLTNSASQSLFLRSTVIENSQNVYMQSFGVGAVNSSVFDCQNLWVTDSNSCEYVGVQNAGFNGCTNSTYDQSASLTVVGSLNEYMLASRNLVSNNVSGTMVENLKDVYQFRDKICTVAVVQAGTPQTIVAGIASASFNNGDMVTVTNSIALLNKATSIAFDTNADNLPDTIAYPLVVGGWQSNYPAALAAAAGNFYLMYYNGKFHLLFSVLNCPFQINANNSYFDGIVSNFSKTVNFNAGSIAISDPTNYDYSHCGVLTVSHVGGSDVLSSITHTSGKYPNIKRDLRNGNVAASLWFSHGVGANLITTPGGVLRQMGGGPLDVMEIWYTGSQWQILRATTFDDASYTQKTIISIQASQLQNMFSSAILAVPAPVLGKAIRLQKAHLVFRHGNNQYNFGSQFYLQWGQVPTNIVASNQAPTAGGIDSAADTLVLFDPINGNVPLTGVAGIGLYLSAPNNSVNAPSPGTVIVGTLLVEYKIIDLP